MPPSTFTDALIGLEAAASSKLFHGYGPRPIPHELDGQVEQFIDAYLSAAPDERTLLESLPDFAASVLLAFAERRAAFAIRMKSKQLLLHSVVAVGLAAEIGDDDREGMLVMPLPWHSAELLGVDPAEVFKHAAAILPETGTRALLAFSQRLPEDRTLSCMGYEAGSDEGGFRYVRTW